MALITEFVHPNFDRTDFASRQVLVGVSITLPYRLRLGEFRRIRFQHGEGRFDFSFRNKIDSPSLKPPDFSLSKKLRVGERDPNWEEQKRYFDLVKSPAMFTDAILIAERPRVSSESCDAIRRGHPHLESGSIPGSLVTNTDMMWRKQLAFDAFNQFLAAYSATAEIFYPGNLPAPISLIDQHYITRVYFSFLCERGRDIDEADIQAIMKYSEGWNPGGIASYAGPMNDLAEEEFDMVRKTLEKMESFSFYEFMFDAKYRWAIHDRAAGFLMAVIALEGIHSAFVSVCLRPGVESMGKSKHSNDAVDALFKDTGFYSLIRLTPILFMSEEERPPVTLVDECLDAITSRNKLVHSLKVRNKPSARRSGFKKIGDHYNAVVKMYECLLSAFERRVQ